MERPVTTELLEHIKAHYKFYERSLTNKMYELDKKKPSTYEERYDNLQEWKQITEELQQNRQMMEEMKAVDQHAVDQQPLLKTDLLGRIYEHFVFYKKLVRSEQDELDRETPSTYDERYENLERWKAMNDDAERIQQLADDVNKVLG